MKICKVKFTKKFDGNRCQYIYPKGYDAKIMNVLSYEDNPLIIGDNITCCIAAIPNDFIFTDDMVEITQADANTFIDAEAAKITATLFDQKTGVRISLKSRYKERKLTLAKAIAAPQQKK